MCQTEVDSGWRQLSPTKLFVEYGCHQWATRAAWRPFTQGDVCFECQWLSQPTCISAYRPRITSSLFAPSSDCCKTLCLYSTYLFKKDSNFQSVGIAGKTLCYLDAYQRLRAGRNILCFFTQDLVQRCVFSASIFTVSFFFCLTWFVKFVVLYKNEKWNKIFIIFCMEKKRM